MKRFAWFMSASLVIPAVLWAQPATPEAAGPVGSDAFGEGLRWLVDLLRMRFGENTFLQVLASFALLLVAFVFRKALLVVFFAQLRKATGRTAWKHDDRLVKLLEAPVSVFSLIVGVFFAVMVLTLPSEADLFALRVFQAGTVTVAFWGFLRIVDLVADALEEGARERQMAIHAFLPLIKKAARIFLIVIGVILVVQNLGYSVGSLLAGLGIGGLAVALAAQESLGNFFGSVSIAADRPFKIGDWIQVGDKVDGVVEEVGLRSTRVRTWARSQLTIPNKVLAGEIIQNVSQAPTRRVVQTIGVTYETTPEQMEALLEDFAGILRQDPGVDQETILVHFMDFGASSLDIRVLYFTKSTAGLEHLAVRQRVNLAIMRAVAARGLSIAFPTRTVYFEGEIARKMAQRGL
jgi:MscS family membrane protein